MNSFVGIDVDMVWLVCALLVEGRVTSGKFKNTAEGFEKLLKWAFKCSGGEAVMFGLEATGAYHRALELYLAEHKLSMKVFNPRQIRDLAKGLGIQYKNDKVDAKTIAKALQMSNPKPSSVRSKVHGDLKQIRRRVAKLTQLRTNEKKRMQSPSLADGVKKSMKRSIDHLDKEIRELEKLWLKIVASEKEISKIHKDVLSIAGIGEKTASMVASEVEMDCSKRTVKQIVSYFAAAPRQKSSGAGKPQGHIEKAGNRYLYNCLHMPSLLLISRETETREFYNRLVSKGKTPKQALAAVKRKLAMRIAIVLVRRSPWEAVAPTVAKS